MPVRRFPPYVAADGYLMLRLPCSLVTCTEYSQCCNHLNCVFNRYPLTFAPMGVDQMCRMRNLDQTVWMQQAQKTAADDLAFRSQVSWD